MTVRVVVPLGYPKVRVGTGEKLEVEDEVPTAEVREVPNELADVQGRVELPEQPAQTVMVVAHSRPQVVTLDVTVLAWGSWGRASMSEGLMTGN
jgi:hypothetical protein